MPIHDWTRVRAGTYHNFHQGWTIQLRDALNAGVLPNGYYATADQRVGGPEPDVVALQFGAKAAQSWNDGGGVAVVEAPPRMRKQATLPDEVTYALKANRISIRDEFGRVVAVIEIVSPGNKHSERAFRSFIEKCADFVQKGIHLLIVDLFPPTARDPRGIHHAIWSDMLGGSPEMDEPGKSLTVAGYDAQRQTAYYEPLAVGDMLPEAPLFLEAGFYVPAPLEATYERSWSVLPAIIRNAVAPEAATPRPGPA